MHAAAMDLTRLRIIFCVTITLASTASAFYLPGVAPQDYQRDDIVNVKVNKLSSVRTQLPFDYYSSRTASPRASSIARRTLGRCFAATASRIHHIS